MRRTIGFALTAIAVALVAAAPAAASQRAYIGDVSGGGQVGFILKKSKKGKKTVKRFTLLEVPIACDEGANTASGRLDFKVKVKQKQFEADAAIGDGQLTIEGTVRGHGSHGTLRAFGSTPLDDDTTGTNCDTGTLDWDATRQ